MLRILKTIDGGFGIFKRENRLAKILRNELSEKISLLSYPRISGTLIPFLKRILDKPEWQTKYFNIFSEVSICLTREKGEP